MMANGNPRVKEIAEAYGIQRGRVARMIVAACRANATGLHMLNLWLSSLGPGESPTRRPGKIGTLGAQERVEPPIRLSQLP